MSKPETLPHLWVIKIFCLPRWGRLLGALWQHWRSHSHLQLVAPMLEPPRAMGALAVPPTHTPPRLTQATQPCHLPLVTCHQYTGNLSTPHPHPGLRHPYFSEIPLFN